VRLWRISDRRTAAVFSHDFPVICVTLSTDDKYIICGGRHENIVP